LSDDGHRTHEGDHPHVHFPGCGHETRRHEDHDDFEHDGHWHAKDGDHYDEHEAVNEPDTAGSG
jgi:zinc transport system permease protein